MTSSCLAQGRRGAILEESKGRVSRGNGEKPGESGSVETKERKNVSKEEGLYGRKRKLPGRDEKDGHSKEPAHWGS